MKSEYFAYQTEPKLLSLSIRKIEETFGKPIWSDLAHQGGFLQDAKNEDGLVTKASYRSGLEQYLLNNDVEYEEPSALQALSGIANLFSFLPEFYLLPAITDYSSEIDRRSSSTVFCQLMGNLSERLLHTDPRYTEIEDAINRIRSLLNPQKSIDASPRMAALDDIELQLQNVLKELMPSVQTVNLNVEIENAKEIFSRGIAIKINDGVVTDVVDKGHGLQRCLIFSLLQMLIKAGRGTSINNRPIFLAIEEPELYIHPHCQRLIFSVLKGFAGVTDDPTPTQIGADQTIYTTHSPSFVEIANYERIGVVRKPNCKNGTVVHQCPAGVLGSVEERKGFKLLTSFGIKHNDLFFARNAILVEGPEDEIGIIATARKLGRIKDLPDEIGLTIIVTDGKGDICKFQKILNAFQFNYGVMLELDGKGENDKQTVPILENINGNRIGKLDSRLETLLGLNRHFEDQRHAKEFFSNPANINEAMENLVVALLPEATQVPLPQTFGLGIPG